MTYIWRTLFQRKIRTGLSMLGVSVSVAGIVALISVAEGMKGSLDAFMTDTGASLTVFSREVADLIFSAVGQEDIETIAGLEGVEEVSRAHFFIVRPPQMGADPPTLPMVFVFGRFPEERLMDRYEELVEEGRLFEREPEIVISTFLAEQLKWRVGQKIPLFGREFEIVGTFKGKIAWENGGMLMHADILGEQLGRKDNYAIVFVYTAEEDTHAVKARIEKALPHLRAVPAGEFTESFADQLEIMDKFILLITIIALVVGVLGVLNTMMMSVAERTREIGMLRALGWSRGRIIRTIMTEGMLLSAIGGLFGLVFGVLGTEGLIRLIPDTYLEATYSTKTFVTGAIVGLLVGVLAALYPAVRASNLRPVEALRYE